MPFSLQFPLEAGSLAGIKRITEFFTVVTVSDRNIIGILFHNVFIACLTRVDRDHREFRRSYKEPHLCYRFPENRRPRSERQCVLQRVPVRSPSTPTDSESLNIVADFLLNIWIFGCNVRHTNRACVLPANGFSSQYLRRRHANTRMALNRCLCCCDRLSNG